MDPWGRVSRVPSGRGELLHPKLLGVDAGAHVLETDERLVGLGVRHADHVVEQIRQGQVAVLPECSP